jgi:hypothetical protein
MTSFGLRRTFGVAVTLVLASGVANATTVVIQPSSQDAYLRQDKPNRVFGNSTVDRIEVQSSTPNPRIERGLVQFDLSSIPASKGPIPPSAAPSPPASASSSRAMTAAS